MPYRVLPIFEEEETENLSTSCWRSKIKILKNILAPLTSNRNIASCAIFARDYNCIDKNQTKKKKMIKKVWKSRKNVFLFYTFFNIVSCVIVSDSTHYFTYGLLKIIKINISVAHLLSFFWLHMWLQYFLLHICYFDIGASLISGNMIFKLQTEY